MKKIERNAIRCLHCGDVIESKSVHDYVQCSCGSCSVDGGHEYLRRGYITSPEIDYEELATYIELPSYKIWYYDSIFGKFMNKEVLTNELDMWIDANGCTLYRVTDKEGHIIDDYTNPDGYSWIVYYSCIEKACFDTRNDAMNYIENLCGDNCRYIEISDYRVEVETYDIITHAATSIVAKKINYG